MWQPIETAPKDQFLLLCGLSGYTTTPMVVTTGCMCSDYHVGRWIDHANDDLTDWGFTPTHWAPLILPGAHPAPRVPEGWLRAIDEALVVAHIGVANERDTYEQAKAKLNNLIGFHVDVATDPAVNGGWKLVPIEPTVKIRKAMHYAYWKSPQLPYHDGSPELWNAAYAAMLAAAPEAKP